MFRTKIILMIAVLVLSCDKFEPKKHFDIPLPSDPVFNWENEVVVSGSTMIFSPLINPSDLAKISEYSTNTRVEIVRSHKLQIPKVQLVNSLNELNSKFLPIISVDFDELSIAQRKLVLKNTYENFMSSASVLANNPAKQLFGQYCEAKIWDFALTKAVEKFNKRPTPSQICEEYYKENSLLSSNEEACQGVQEEGGNNYFQCFWREGVLKSNIFKSRFNDFSKEAITNWLEETDDNPTSILQTALSGRFANRVIEAAMNFVRFSENRFDRLGLGDYDTFKDIFVPEVNETILEVEVPANIKIILDSIDNTSTPTNCEGWCLLAQSLEVDNFKSRLQLISSSVGIGQSNISLNDYLFNSSEALNIDWNLRLFIDLAEFEDLVPMISGEDPKIIGNYVFLAKQIANDNQKLIAINKELDESSKLQEQYGRAAAALAIQKDNVAYTFFPIGSKLAVNTSDDIQEIILTVHHSAALNIKVCIDRKSQNQIICPDFDDTKFVNAKVVRSDMENQKSMAIAYAFDKDPSQIGFNYKPRLEFGADEFEFNDIHPDKLIGNILAMSIQFNKIDDLVFVAAVNLQVIDPKGQPLYEGGLTLIEQ